jgi:hypothetical protein
MTDSPPDPLVQLAALGKKRARRARAPGNASATLTAVPPLPRSTAAAVAELSCDRPDAAAILTALSSHYPVFFPFPLAVARQSETQLGCVSSRRVLMDSNVLASRRLQTCNATPVAADAT